MSPNRKRSLGGWLVAALWISAPGCHQDQLRTARVISESQGQVIVAMPENTPYYRGKAEKLAKGKLGKDLVFVEGKEVTTDDENDKTIKASFVKNAPKTIIKVHRREYHVTFRGARSVGG